jgi:hypothetical protein
MLLSAPADAKALRIVSAQGAVLTLSNDARTIQFDVAANEWRWR